MSKKTRLIKLERQLHISDKAKEPIIIEDYSNTDPTAFFMLALGSGRPVHAGNNVYDGAALRMKHWGHL